MKTIVVVFLEFINLLAMFFRLVVKTGVAIFRIAANLSLRASSGGKRQQIQHGDDHDCKVNKDSSCCFFEYDQSFGHDRGIINTEQTAGSLVLRYSTPRRVVKSLGLSPSTFHYAPRG